MSRKPSDDEATAIAAAIARFQAEMTPAASPEPALSPWRRAALIEGVSAKPSGQDPEGGSKWLS